MARRRYASATRAAHIEEDNIHQAHSFLFENPAHPCSRHRSVPLMVSGMAQEEEEIRSLRRRGSTLGGVQAVVPSWNKTARPTDRLKEHASAGSRLICRLTAKRVFRMSAYYQVGNKLQLSRPAQPPRHPQQVLRRSSAPLPTDDRGLSNTALFQKLAAGRPSLPMPRNAI